MRGVIPSPVSILELDSVTLQRQEKPVLRNLNLVVQPGEHWVILGPNGSGKSSLLSMIQGFLWPQQGDITLMGRRFGEENIDMLRKKIGWVSSEIENRFRLKESGRSLLLSGAVGTMGLQFESPSASHKKQATVLSKRLGVEHLMKKPFGEMSQGERRIVAIARSLMMEPALLILDEACAGLDPVARELFLKRLTNLGGLPSSPSILFATHHVEEIRAPFTHVMMLQKGRIVASGPLRKTLNSKNLSTLFGRDVSLKRIQGRYSLFV